MFKKITPEMYESAIQAKEVAEKNFKIQKEAREDDLRMHQFELEKVKKDSELKDKDWQFRIDHLESEKIKELDSTVTDLTKKLAVSEKENEMLKQINDLNADIIDVKDLVGKIVDKLPEIKLSSLTVGGKAD